jgi:RHS repeat-associated protein
LNVPTGQIWKYYYYAGAQRIAMRTVVDTTHTVNWILGDHLGSTSVVATKEGAEFSRTLYKPWGEVRYQSGTLPTDYTFTGQRSHVDDFGLMFYVARWYDPYLNRFIQPDSIVPNSGNPQDYDRFSYVRNNT